MTDRLRNAARIRRSHDGWHRNHRSADGQQISPRARKRLAHNRSNFDERSTVLCFFASIGKFPLVVQSAFQSALSCRPRLLQDAAPAFREAAVRLVRSILAAARCGARTLLPFSERQLKTRAYGAGLRYSTLWRFLCLALSWLSRRHDPWTRGRSSASARPQRCRPRSKAAPSGVTLLAPRSGEPLSPERVVSTDG